MKKAKGKRGRKPKYATEAERKEAHNKSQAKCLLKKQGKTLNLISMPGDWGNVVNLRLEKLEKDVEIIKWELFGRQK